MYSLTVYGDLSEVVLFSLECQSCNVSSPNTDSTLVLPTGWTSVSETKGITITTTFCCPSCSIIARKKIEEGDK